MGMVSSQGGDDSLLFLPLSFTGGVSVRVPFPCLHFPLTPTSKTSPLGSRQTCWPHFLRENVHSKLSLPASQTTLSVHLDGN